MDEDRVNGHGNEDENINKGSKGDDKKGTSPPLCTEEDLERLSRYKMNHTNRGIALIFNHEKFKSKALAKRGGAEEEGKIISNALENLGFEVRNHMDLNLQEIQDTLAKVAGEKHDDCDCLLVAIMTYESKNGSLLAFDKEYKEESVWSLFVTEKVKSLGGKPKIFLFQTSPVQILEKKDGIVDSRDSPAERRFFRPTHADFLKVYSCGTGLSATADGNNGSSFLQLLSKDLQEYAAKADFVSILTRTLYKVKTTFQPDSEPNSDADSKKKPPRKEMPIVTSTLTGRLFFEPKPHNLTGMSEN